MPQPESGCVSESRVARIHFAARDASNRDGLSFRRWRMPATMPGVSPRSCNAASIAGKSAGTFWPSPSSTPINTPRACHRPDHNAALWPERISCRNTRNCGTVFCKSDSSAAVPSVLASSMITNAST